MLVPEQIAEAIPTRVKCERVKDVIAKTMSVNNRDQGFRSH